MKRSLEHWVTKNRDYEQEIHFGDMIGWSFVLLLIAGAYLWYR